MILREITSSRCDSKFGRVTAINVFSKWRPPFCILSEVKFDVTVSTSVINLVKISQRAAELWRYTFLDRSSVCSCKISSRPATLVLISGKKLKMAALRHLELLLGNDGPPTKFSC